MWQKLNPYFRLMRLHQPIGIWLVYWPCAWALLLTSSDGLPIANLIIFALGAVLARSMGCIVNDIVDRDFDKEVERTKTRPLASGELTVKQAYQALAVLGVLGLSLFFFLPLVVFFLAIPGAILAAAYPFMKRITWWPQAFLGLAFNWGAIMAWAATGTPPSWATLTLYLACIFWTLGYDTIYGHQDKKDDARIGIKSTSLHLGGKTKRWVNVFYSLTIALLGVSLLLIGSVISFFHVLGMGFLACHFSWQVRVVNLDDPQSCLRVFKSNGWAGGMWLLPGFAVLLFRTIFG